jgi:hypothetical protein
MLCFARDALKDSVPLADDPGPAIAERDREQWLPISIYDWTFSAFPKTRLFYGTDYIMLRTCPKNQPNQTIMRIFNEVFSGVQFIDANWIRILFLAVPYNR